MMPAAACLLLCLAVGCGKTKNPIVGDASPEAVAEPIPPVKQTKSKPAPQKPKYKAPVTKRPGQRELSKILLDKHRAERYSRYMVRLRERESAAERAVVVSGRESAELLTLLKNSGNTEERVAAVVELGGRDEVEAQGLLRDIAMAAGRPTEERVAALEALAELPRAEHLPAVETALEATDEEVRAAGVWLLTRIHSDAAQPLWQRVMSDGSPELVALAFEALPEAPEGLQTAAATAALRRGEAWMTEQALVTLGGITSKPAVEALIPMIDHPTSGDLAHDGLMFLLGESFDSSSAAQRWWLANRSKLDATLQPVE